MLREHVPQGHKVALVDLPEGTPVLRYNVTIGYALKDIRSGSWVHERLLKMPPARVLENLPIATVKPEPQPPLEGYTFEGYQNLDGSVGTRNILAITQTVQCVAGVTDFAVQRIKTELLPKFPNVDDVVGLDHTYGCGVAIDAPDAIIPIRTLRNISLNPNFGGEVMVVSSDPDRPYERPYLSKEYLRGQVDLPKVYLHGEGDYSKEKIELLLGRRAVGGSLSDRRLGREQA